MWQVSASVMLPSRARARGAVTEVQARLAATKARVEDVRLRLRSEVEQRPALLDAAPALEATYIPVSRELNYFPPISFPRIRWWSANAVASLARASAVGRTESDPVIVTARLVLPPEIMWSIRWLIGQPKLTDTPDVPDRLPHLGQAFCLRPTDSSGPEQDRYDGDGVGNLAKRRRDGSGSEQQPRLAASLNGIGMDDADGSLSALPCGHRMYTG